MTWLGPVRVYASAHGVRWRLVVASMAGFLLIGPLAQWHVPQVDPDPHVMNRPLEQLGTLVLAAMPAFGAVALPDRAGWLTATSPRSVHLTRAVWAGSILCFTTVMWRVAATLLPASIDRSHVVGVWVLVMSVTLILSCIVPAIITPSVVLVVAALSTFGAIPWSLNLFYNPALGNWLWAFALLGATTGCSLYGWIGESASRRAHYREG